MHVMMMMSIDHTIHMDAPDNIRDVFHLPLHEAAEALGMTTTTLRLRCRTLWPHRGFRWPARILRSMMRLAGVLGAPSPAFNSVQRIIQTIKDNPCKAVKLPPSVRQLRQNLFTDTYSERLKNAHESSASNDISNDAIGDDAEEEGGQEEGGQEEGGQEGEQDEPLIYWPLAQAAYIDSISDARIILV